MSRITAEDLHSETFKLDIDVKPDYVAFVQDFVKRFNWLVFLFGRSLYFDGVRVRETVKGFHLYVFVLSEYPLDPVEVVYAQLALGSDFKREGFNIIRVLDGDEESVRSRVWNLLFLDKERVTFMSQLLERGLEAALVE